MRAFSLAMRVRPHGTVWGAPKCTDWVFIARHGTGRTKRDPGGNVRVPRVARSNRMTVLVSMLYLLAWMRSCHVFLEHPISSLMVHYSPMQELVSSVMKNSVVTYLGAFKAESVKPVKLWSSTPLIAGLKRTRPSAMAKLVVKKGTSVTGKKDVLRASQAYPNLFGKAVSNIVKKLILEASMDDYFEESMADMLVEYL